MTDLIRDAFAQYEQRMVDTTDGLAFQRIRLDEVVPDEEQILRIEAIADPTAKSPEQIYIPHETMREMYAGLEKLSDREQAYLLYRYGFTDDLEHEMIGTAIHFSLRESRAKKLEEDAMDNLWLELSWWFKYVSPGWDGSLYIPLLPFPVKRILPYEQIHISSVSVQNPPALLPPKSVCQLQSALCHRCKENIHWMSCTLLYDPEPTRTPPSLDSFGRQAAFILAYKKDDLKI